MILRQGGGIFHWNSRDHYFFLLEKKSTSSIVWQRLCWEGCVKDKDFSLPSPLRIESIPSFIYFCSLIFSPFLSFCFFLSFFFSSPSIVLPSQRKPEEPIKTKESRIPRVSCRGGVKGSSCKEEGEGILSVDVIG